MSKSRVLVTPALPYANGDIHIGHLVEHLQVNTYVRALRMAGDEVLCVCGADSHGAGIEIAAKKDNIAPEVYVEQVRRRQEKSFERFAVDFDGGYGTTHTSENEAHAGRIWQALKDKGHVFTKEVEQLQDPTDGRFLADRFVIGECPKCGKPDQYGDSCEHCMSTYRATELKNPKSVVTGATPTLGKSEHYMVRLAPFADDLKAYLARDGVLHPSLQNFLDAWFEGGLKDWDVSRDGPYFGFKIPGEDNKYFYVWLDAPVGYVSLTERALDTGPGAHNILGGASSLGRSALTSAYDAKKRTWQDFWTDPECRVEHFIGKDILYFHTLFWPAMLMASSMNLPRHIRVHGMLTVDGVKMSKSRGTFINADTFAEHCEPEALRYYFAAKTSSEPTDIDLSIDDLVNRVNADLVKNLVNLLSRAVPLLHRFFAGRPTTMPDAHGAFIHDVQERAAMVPTMYKDLDTAGVCRTVCELGNTANKLMQDAAPWELAKTDPEAAHGVLTVAIWAGKTCLALLKPVLPVLAAGLEKLFDAEFTFENAADPLPLNKAVGVYEHLFARLDVKKVAAMVQPAADADAPKPEDTKKAKKDKPKGPPPPPEVIAFEDFTKVNLRVGKVIKAVAVEGSSKLIQVQVDLGPLGERQIFSGLRPHVEPEQMLGRHVVVVVNLAPRQMAKFGESHGMILAAGEVPVPLFMDDVAPGSAVG